MSHFPLVPSFFPFGTHPVPSILYGHLSSVSWQPCSPIGLISFPLFLYCRVLLGVSGEDCVPGSRGVGEGEGRVWFGAFYYCVQGFLFFFAEGMDV